jgi:hypothetical protein
MARLRHGDISLGAGVTHASPGDTIRSGAAFYRILVPDGVSGSDTILFILSEHVSRRDKIVLISASAS